jgi:hypothetical protein
LVAGCFHAHQQLAQSQHRSRTGKVALKDRKDTKGAELLVSDVKQSDLCQTNCVAFVAPALCHTLSSFSCVACIVLLLLRRGHHDDGGGGGSCCNCSRKIEKTGGCRTDT